MAGIIIPSSWGVSLFVSRVVPHLIAPERVAFRKWTSHFTHWNPTQYKLDLQLFADEYDIILWLDSDSIIVRGSFNIVINVKIIFCSLSAT